MNSPTQNDRLIAINTPLGDNKLLLKALGGTESLSSHFEYTANVELVDQSSVVQELLGQPVTIDIERFDGSYRAISGRVSKIIKATSTADAQLVIRPWLYMLEYSKDCMVYRELTVIDIIEKVLSRHFSIANYEVRATGTYPQLDFTVQYNESDANFIHRLCEQFGLYYFYEHTRDLGDHKLILCDHESCHAFSQGYEIIPFDKDKSNASRESEVITSWNCDCSFESSVFTTKDFDYTRSHTDVSGSVDVSAFHKNRLSGLEAFSYPGRVAEKNDAYNKAEVIAEAACAASVTVRATSTARGLACGELFSLTEHEDSNQNIEYLTTSVSISASVGEFRSGLAGSDFRCEFTAIKKTTQYRDSSHYANPKISGVQTAIVVGPEGKEIWTNEFGCVKLKFHWDRSDYQNEHSSGWVRVNFAHAGKGFGGYDIPRIGEEVSVQFLEGNPDRPIVVGRLYNDFNNIPLDLPSDHALVGMKTQSTPGGGGFNELTLDDTKGKEKIYMRAQKDMTLLIKNDLFETVENNEAISVLGNQKLNVKGQREIFVGASSAADISSTYDLNAGGAVSIKSDSQISLEVGGSTLRLTPSSIDIKTSGNISINGAIVSIN